MSRLGSEVAGLSDLVEFPVGKVYLEDLNPVHVVVAVESDSLQGSEVFEQSHFVEVRS